MGLPSKTRQFRGALSHKHGRYGLEGWGFKGPWRAPWAVGSGPRRMRNRQSHEVAITYAEKDAQSQIIRLRMQRGHAQTHFFRLRGPKGMRKRHSHEAAVAYAEKDA